MSMQDFQSIADSFAAQVEPHRIIPVLSKMALPLAVRIALETRFLKLLAARARADGHKARLPDYRGGSGVEWSDEQCLAMIAAYESPMTVAAVSRQFGVDNGALGRLLSEAGVNRTQLETWHARRDIRDAAKITLA